MCSEPVKLTEVADKRLLKATPKGRKILIFADNSNYVYVRGVRLLRTFRTLDESLNFVKTAAFKPHSFNHFCTLLPIKCFVSNIVVFLVSG